MCSYSFFARPPQRIERDPANFLSAAILEPGLCEEAMQVVSDTMGRARDVDVLVRCASPHRTVACDHMQLHIPGLRPLPWRCAGPSTTSRCSSRIWPR